MMMHRTNYLHLSWLWIVFGCTSPPIPAPTTYESYSSTDKFSTFRCEFPQGWESRGGGRNNAHARFSHGSAVIQVQTDVLGSILGDIGGPSSANLPPEFEPVARVHEVGRKAVADEFDQYEEVGDTIVVDCGLGPCRKSEFTAATTFGGRIHGVRATILTKDRRVTVVCQSPEQDWPNLETAFDRVIASFQKG